MGQVNATIAGRQYRLACEDWGGGYASEGARAVLDYGFTTLGLREIVAFTTASHQRSGPTCLTSRYITLGANASAIQKPKPPTTDAAVCHR